MKGGAEGGWIATSLDQAGLGEVLQLLPDAALLVDGRGRIAAVNARAGALLRRGPEGLAGRPIDFLVPRRLVASLRRFRAGFVRAPRCGAMPAGDGLAARAGDGGEVALEVWLAPLRSGRSLFVLALLRAARPAARALRERARGGQHSALLELWDRVVRTASVAEGNRNCIVALQKLLGLDEAEIYEVARAPRRWRARRVDSISHGGHSAGEWLDSIAGIDLGGLLDPSENDGAGLQVLHAGGQCMLFLPLRTQRWVHGLLRLARPVAKGFDAESVYVARSVGNLLAHVHERDERDRLELTAAKLEVLGQLSGGLAHDFNNLLGIVAGSLDLLESRLVDDAGSLALLASARRAVARGGGLTHRMLTVARKRPVSLVPINLAKSMPGLLELVRSAVGEHIDLEVQLPAELPAVLGDVALLDACVINLATNARDAMPGGGRLTIGVELAELHAPPGEVHSGLLEPGAYVVLSVADTGTGMTDEVKSRVFEPFFTTKDPGHGSGLGLKMVASLMHQAGGRVGLSSAPGAGTVVRLCFRPTSAEAMPAGAAGPFPRGAGERVLVVEDDEAVRDTAVMLLGDIGYRSVAAATIGEALALIEAHPDVALVFTDVVLARGETGVQLAERVLASHPRLPVVLTSGYASPVLERCGPLLRELPMLSKPYSREQLAEAMRSALRHR